MASELRVDKIIPTSGVPATGGGGVVQVVHGTKTGEVTITTTTFQDTGLTATITPKLDSFYELDLSSVTWPTEPS